MNTEFTKKRIGNKNIELEQKIIKLYMDLCRQANEIAFILDSYLGYQDLEHLDPSMFFEFMNCKDPQAFLYSKYIEKHGIIFPGISISKVIELELADVPLETFDGLLKCRNKLLKSIQSTDELKFHFPLIDLWSNTFESFCLLDIDKEQNYTFESADFESKLNQHTGNFTVSESDNIILKAIENAIESFNELVSLGIIKNDKSRWANGIANLSNAIVFNRNEEKPLSVNPRLNRLHDFRRFFTESNFNPVIGRLQDILKFVKPAPEPEAMTEDEVTETEQAESEHEETFANE
jgi:hypothetical protein